MNVLTITAMTTNSTPPFQTLAGLLHISLYGLPSKESSTLRNSYTDRSRHNTLPRFLPTPTNYTFQVGQLAVLKCEVENLGKKRVGWRRAADTNPLTVGTMTFVDDHRITIERPPMTNEWNLLIKNVQLEDTGVYECQISSKVRHLRYHVLLTVKEPVKTSNFQDIRIRGKNFVEKGERIFLECSATGREYPPEDLDWFKNGNKLTTEYSNKVYIRKSVTINTKTIVSILEINDSKLQDAGTYVCRTSDQQVTSTRVNVLNAGTYNVRRDAIVGETNSSSYYSDAGTCYLKMQTLLLIQICVLLCRTFLADLDLLET